MRRPPKRAVLARALAGDIVFYCGRLRDSLAILTPNLNNNRTSLASNLCFQTKDLYMNVRQTMYKYCYPNLGAI